MFKEKSQEVRASDIAEYLNAVLHGDDIILNGPKGLRTMQLNSELSNEDGSSEPYVLLTKEPYPQSSYASYVITSNPERDFALIIREFFATPDPIEVHPSSCIASDVIIGRNVHIGAHCVIDSGVEIGDFVWIMNNVNIHGPVIIGKGSVIKDGAVIGSEGYGFVEDENGHLFHPPQLGRIVLGENVWVGTNSTIERAMIKDTIIADGVKIDDLVHIGNGSYVGFNSMITAGCIIAHDVRIGENVTLAPNVSVRENCSIASSVLIGQGGVVVKDINTPGIYIGVPVENLNRQNK